MAISKGLRTVGLAILIIPTLAVSAAVVVPEAFGNLRPPATAGLPSCSVAEEPAPASRYDQWATTLLDPAHTLGPSYAPPDLRTVELRGREATLRRFVIRPLVDMLDAAARDGVVVRVTSSYRSYSDQLALLAENPDETDL